MDYRLHIDTNAPIGIIKPRLYGHFAEHLGRCCYDGLWCADTKGEYNFREDVVAALKALPVPLLRWPGGCYADHYHWRDGIGSPDQRTRRIGMSCGLQVEDDNSLGTHEFIDLCRRIGAEPYLAGNVGSGTPQELCDWVEYCNASINTSLVQQRRANGGEQPFDVRLWGIGNENWGCGGNFDAPSYAREYRRFATMVRHVDPKAELVITGSGDAQSSDDSLYTWDIELIQTLRPHLDLIDHFSTHSYWIHGGPEIDFSEADYYELFADVQRTEDFILRTSQMLKEEAGKRSIGIALDEWGVWHPEAREWGPHGTVQARSPITYEQAGTLRDGLAVGAMLETLCRHCNILSMANLAQIVNVLHASVMTEGHRMWVTPTYYALQLHTPHMGAEALPVAIEQSNSLPNGTSAVTATASRRQNGVAVTLINRHYSDEALVRLTVPGKQAAGRLLSAEHANAVNSADAPDHVRLVDIAVSQDGLDRWCIELPPHSMVTIIVQ